MFEIVVCYFYVLFMRSWGYTVSGQKKGKALGTSGNLKYVWGIVGEVLEDIWGMLGRFWDCFYEVFRVV